MTPTDLGSRPNVAAITWWMAFASFSRWDFSGVQFGLPFMNLIMQTVATGCDDDTMGLSHLG